MSIRRENAFAPYSNPELLRRPLFFEVGSIVATRRPEANPGPHCGYRDASRGAGSVPIGAGWHLALLEGIVAPVH